MIDLSQIKKIHFTGIKGVGMTALACIAKDFGCQISGSDTNESFVTDCVLEKKGISWTADFSPAKIEEIKPDLLIYTVAHSGEENVEVIKAQHLQIPTLSQAQALGAFAQTKKTTISIAGVGGKTTVTAWLSTVLECLDFHPSYMIGVGFVPSLNYSGKYDFDGDIFICEADEYKSSIYDIHPKFYYQNPKIIIIPNLSFDHPDVYKSEEETLQNFKTFIEKLPSDGALIINSDSILNQKLLKISNLKAKTLTYGETNGEFRISNFSNKSFDFLSTRFNISLFGKFNALNAAAVVLACQFLNINLEKIKSCLPKYTGIERRFQKIWQKNSTFIYDDYAHHPEEIKTTLEAFRLTFPQKKLITIFQPHTFSRTKSLFREFTQSFKNTDKLILLPIFASARETHDDSISSQILNDSINQISHNSIYLEKEKVAAFLKTQNLENTIILTMGAGDVYELGKKIIGIF